MALAENDIQKIIIALGGALDVKLDKKFEEQNEVINLKLQALESRIESKGMVWAEKTVNEILKGMGFDVDQYKEIQSDQAFLHWLRVLCTNMVTKAVMVVACLFGVTFCIEYLRSKGINFKQ